MINIVKMSIDHLNDVEDISKACFTVSWSKESLYYDIVENKNGINICAINNNGVVGFAGMHKILDEGHIMNMAVIEGFRGKGIGSLLMESLICEAQKEKITKMTLEVASRNTVAISLYEKFGFIKKGIRVNYYDKDMDDAVIMWKYSL